MLKILSRKQDNRKQLEKSFFQYLNPMVNKSLDICCEVANGKHK